MSYLPDELWRRILETGLSFRDLCSLSITCSRLRRLSADDALWSLLLRSNFPTPSPPHLTPSKSLFQLRFERQRDKMVAGHRRAVLRKESQVAEHSRRIADLEARLSHEADRARASILELSNLRLIRQASAALNVWQPELVRGRHKQMVEQNVVPVTSRVRELEMELRLCKHQILVFERAYKDEKRRLDMAKDELSSLNYHPMRPKELLMSSEYRKCKTNVKAKRPKRSCCQGHVSLSPSRSQQD